MTEALAPADLPAATRGEFLANRERAVRELHKELSSPLGLLQNCALVLGAAVGFFMAGAAFGDPNVETPVVVFVVVLGAAALASTAVILRRSRRRRELTAVRLAWETAERQTRSLPPGDIRPELRMPFDARAAADFEFVAFWENRRAELRVPSTMVSLRTISAAMGLLLGFVLVMGGFSAVSVKEAVGWWVAGGYLLICSVVSIADAFRTTWRLRRVWQAQQAEIRAWRADRMGPVAAAGAERAWSRKWWLLSGPHVGAPVMGVVVGAMTRSPAAVAIAVAVVVLAELVVGVMLLVSRRRRRAAAPAEHDLTPAPPG